MPRTKISVTAPSIGLSGAMAVRLYKADGSSAMRAFTTETGSTEHTYPVLVAAGATADLWVFPDQQAVLSTIVNGLEMGGGVGVTKGLATSADSVVRPNVPAASASQVVPVGSALGTTGTIDLDMAALNDTYQTITLTGNPTFTTSNRAAGRTVTIKLSAGGSSRTITWPSWIPLGAALPTSLASGKVAVFTVTMFDTTDAAACAAYAAQP